MGYLEYAKANFERNHPRPNLVTARQQSHIGLFPNFDFFNFIIHLLATKGLIMVDVKENDEALKSNSCPKADAAQIVLIPEIVTITSKDKGIPVVGLNIDQRDNTKKALQEGETVIDVVRDKDEEKTNEQINGEILGGSSKGKRKKPRKWNKKKKVAQKISEMVVGNGNEASAIEVAKNGGEERNEDVIKEALIEKKTNKRKTWIN